MSVFDVGLTPAAKATPPPADAPPAQSESIFDVKPKIAKRHSVFDVALGAPRKALEGADSAVRGSAFDLRQAAGNVAGGIMDILGTPQRAVSGAVSGASRGGVVESINRGAYNAFHPHDEHMVAESDKDVRKLTHLEDLKDHSADPNWLGKVRNFGVDTLEQTVSDPLMLVGVGEMERALMIGGKIAQRIPGMGLAMKGAQALGRTEPIRQLNDAVRVAGREKRNSTPLGVATIHHAETVATNDANRISRDWSDQLEKNRPQLEEFERTYNAAAKHKVAAREAQKAGIADIGPEPAISAFPHEVRQDLLQGAYVLGTQRVRALAVASGYKATAEEAARPALNKMTAFRDEYLPKQRIASERDLPSLNSEIDPVFGAGKSRQGKPGYNYEQGIGDESTPLVDRIKGRFGNYTRDIERGLAQKRGATNLGLDTGLIRVQMERATMARDRATDPNKIATYQRVIDAQKAKIAQADARYGSAFKPEGIATEGEFQLGDNAAAPAMTMRQAKSKAIVDTGLKGKEFFFRGQDPLTASVKQTGASGITPMDRKAPAAAMTGLNTTVQMLDGHLKSMVANRAKLERIASAGTERAGKTVAAAQEATAGVGDAGMRATAAADPTRAMAGIKSAIDGDAAQSLAAKEWLGSSRASTPQFDAFLIAQAAGRGTKGSIRRVGPGRTMTQEQIVAAVEEARAELQRRIAKTGDPVTAEKSLHEDLKAWRTERASETRRFNATNPNPVSGRVAGAIDSAEKTLGKNQEAVFGAAREGQKIAARGERKVMQGVAGITREQGKAAASSVVTADRIQARKELAEAKNEIAKMRNAAIGQRDERATEIYNAANKITAPAFLKGRLFEEKQQAWGQISLLKGFSQIGKDVMFFNPAPHMKNITVLQIEGPGGERVAAEGARIFATMPPEAFKAQERMLEDAGALSSFFAQRKGLWQDAVDKISPQIGRATEAIKNYSNDKLWKWDIAQRIALWNHLKKSPKYAGKSDIELGAVVNDTLFDYAHKSPLSEVLEGIGAPFPHWRLTNITRQAKALVQNPAAVTRMARVEQVGNQDLGPEHDHYDMGLNAPYDEFAKAVNPATTMPYLATTAGPVGKALYSAGKGDFQDQVGQAPLEGVAREAIRTVMPLGSETTDLAVGGKYPSNANNLTKFGWSLLGAYPRNMRTIFTQKIEEYKRDGQDQFQAERSAQKWMREHPGHGKYPQ